MKRLLPLVLLAFLILSPVSAWATTIAIGTAGGNWSTGATWVGGVAPTAADDVQLTDLDGADVLTVDCNTGSAACAARSIDATGATGTLTHANGKQITMGDGTAGNLTLVAGLTYAPGATSLINFVSTTGTNNITTAGKRMGSLTFNGAGGTWSFVDGMDNTNLSTITVTAGTLLTNNQAVGATSGVSLAASGASTRAITLGTTTWLTSTGGWDITNSSGMTLSAASSTIKVGSSSTTFNGGGLTYGTLQTNTTLTSTLTLNGANTFSTLSVTGSAGVNAHVLLGASQTVSGTCTMAGNSVINRLFLNSDVHGTARTLSCGTFTFSNLDLQDITKAGAGSGNISAITGNSGDCGGNTGWTFTTGIPVYWATSGGTSTGSESAATRWFLATNGTGGAGRSPLCQDTATFDANSIDAGSRTVTQDKIRIGAHDWTSVTNTPTWALGSTAVSFFNNIKLVSGMALSGTTGAYTYEGRSNSTLTSGTLTWLKPLIVDAVDSVGTLTQGDNFLSTNSLTGTSGTWAGASTYTAGFSTLTWNGGTLTETGNVALTGALSVTGGTFMSGVGAVSGGTTASFTGGTSNLKGFSGTGVTHGAGTVTVGTTGIAATTLTKNGAGTMTVNGASTFSGNMTLSSTGIWNVNSNITGSGTLAQTGQTVNIGCAVTLAYNNGSYVGSACPAAALYSRIFGGF